MNECETIKIIEMLEQQARKYSITAPVATEDEKHSQNFELV